MRQIAAENERLRSQGLSEREIAHHNLEHFKELSADPVIRRDQYAALGLDPLLTLGWDYLSGDERSAAIRRAAEVAREKATEFLASGYEPDEDGADFDHLLGGFDYMKTLFGETEVHWDDNEYWYNRHDKDARVAAWVASYNSALTSADD